MADLFSAMALTYRIVKQKKIIEKTESGGEIERFGRNRVCPLAPPFSRLCLVSLYATDEMSHTAGQLEVLTCVRHFVKCHAIKSRE